ncbi:MAG: glycoside hydrolase family 113 [Anaerolineaceae bacterium]
MNFQFRQYRKISFFTLFLLIATSLLTACSGLLQTTSEADTFSETFENYPKAEVVFQVRLPAPLIEGETLVLELLDDVTGVYFNPSHYEMAKQNDQDYFVRLPLIVGEKVNYRFLRQSTQSIYEYTTQNSPVRFRMLLVNGPLVIQDTVAAWVDQPYSGAVGRIRGQLMDQATNMPVPNMAVYVAGMQTISSSDGSFILEGLPLWTHNVVISSLDGAYETFQQGAVISEEATTPIQIGLTKRPTTEVNFIVKVPEGFSTDLPLRLASNLHSLGFAGAELNTGSSMIASNLPVFIKTASDEYSLTINLPVGTDLRYKFTFGDGFWNSELGADGNFVIRDLIVSGSSKTIQKQIEAVQSPNVGEIKFDVSVPATTPSNEQISLQLNSFGWMEPLPMQKTGENQWTYTLYSPTHLIGNIAYRLCRNNQCDSALSDPSQDGAIAVNTAPQIVTLNLSNWLFMDASTTPTSVDTNGGSLMPRTDFIAGYEITPHITDTWKNTINQGLEAIRGTGANWVIVSPTWSITHIDPPLLEPVAGTDLLWPDLQALTVQLSANQLNPVIFPILADSTLVDQFWINSKRDAGWWQTFYDRYHRFMMQNADLAASTNASALILGDPNMNPSMSNGVLTNGEPSNSPANADDQWSQLITDIRSRYNGPIIGVISLPSQLSTLPGWLKDVDAFYVLFSPSMVDSGDLSVQAMVHTFGTALDSLVQPISQQYSKPIIIGINYPSSSIALNGCMDINAKCLEYQNSHLAETTVDLDLQARIYNAAVIASANRTWIKGFIARGYNPLVVVKDQGSSIFGKPASDVLWFWYHFILNKSS